MKYLLTIILLSAIRLNAEIIPEERRITWRGYVGVRGGIPVVTNIFTNMPAGSTFSQVTNALRLAGLASSIELRHVVKLDAGNFTNSGLWIVPSFVELRGSGATNTIVHGTGSGKAVIRFGSEVQGENVATPHAITIGATKGSTNISLNNVTGVSLGSLLCIDQLNDPQYVTNRGTFGTITWNSRTNGSYAQGQTVEVRGMNGTNLVIDPPLYWNYTNSPQALSYTAGCQYAGVSDLTIRAHNTGYTTSIYGAGVKNCWVKGIETDYADGDHIQIYWSCRVTVRDSYFHDGFSHTSGSTDCSVTIAAKSSAVLVENNIFYRMHTGLILNWGTSGNAITYNFAADPFDSGSTNVMMYDYCGNHGAHPMMNLFEGNIGGQFRDDSAWGSSSHNTLFRNWGTGTTLISAPYSGRGAIQTNTTHRAKQGQRAFVLDFQQRFYNVVGNIAGSPYTATNTDASIKVTPTNSPYEGVIDYFRFGYNGVEDTGTHTNGNTRPWDTIIFHGNRDVAGGQQWDSGIADTNIPPSLIYDEKPEFFGDLPWPFVDPSVDVLEHNITNHPSGFRFTFNTQPPATTGGGAQPALHKAPLLLKLRL